MSAQLIKSIKPKIIVNRIFFRNFYVSFKFEGFLTFRVKNKNFEK